MVTKIQIPNRKCKSRDETSANRSGLMRKVHSRRLFENEWFVEFWAHKMCNFRKWHD